jgi:type IV pilus assembly protein PilX
MRPLPEQNIRAIAHPRGYATKQRGVVLFFALVALVVMSLAAVALIRSVDTSTMIAGNLAFKQASTTSADEGVEAAINAMKAIEQQMSTLNKNVFVDPTNVFNNDNAANGYYSNADPTLDLTDPATWTAGAGKSMLVGTDNSGNEVRYIIQRMCSAPNQVASNTNCMLGAPGLDKNGHTTPVTTDICVPPPPPTPNGCPVAGQSPQYRITSRAAGPATNAVSYIQAFVY